MLTYRRYALLLPAMFAALFAGSAGAQSFRVQCPAYTTLHPDPTAASTLAAIAAAGAGATYSSVFPGAIKCQQVSGGDGYATMADGTQTYLFAFGPLSGLQDLANGKPGTELNTVFNAPYMGPTQPDVLAAALTGPRNVGNAGVSDPAAIMNIGVLYGNQPAPLMAIDEGDEFFLTLSNVGMIMRPDLFEQHTIHFHGYPNAASFFDGVPDASVAINIAGSFTYYYTAPDSGTYFWHCHITPPEHLQMGMVGQLYVRPRQNRVPVGNDLSQALIAANQASPLGLAAGSGYNGKSCLDILCSGETPVPPTSAARAPNVMYAYNDGDGSTRYDVEYPIQMMGFDPNFHYVGMTFNPEAFADMKDKYYLLNGRGYPDTINPGPLTTMGADGVARAAQPLPTLISINKSAGQTRALLRLSNLSVTEYSTLATVGIPMHVIAINARLLRDMAGNDMTYYSNSITMGGGESCDVILDAANIPLGTYFLYSTNLDHLSNDAENFGGMMAEIVIK